MEWLDLPAFEDKNPIQDGQHWFHPLKRPLTLRERTLWLYLETLDWLTPLRLWQPYQVEWMLKPGTKKTDDERYRLMVLFNRMGVNPQDAGKLVLLDEVQWGTERFVPVYTAREKCHDHIERMIRRWHEGTLDSGFRMTNPSASTNMPEGGNKSEKGL